MMRRFLHFTTFILRTGMVLLLVTCATLAWLAGTTAGLSQLAEWAQWVGNANGGQLQIERVTGHLWDRFAMGRLHWQSAELDLEIDGLQLDWSPLALAQGRLEIARLTLVSVRVHTPPSQTPTPLPADLQWPFGLGVRIGQWQVGRLVVEGHALAQEISGQYDHDGGQHQLNALRLQGGDVAVAGEVRLADHPPFALAGKLQLCGQVEARPLALTLDLNGYLSRFYVNAVATQGVVGLAQAVVIPLALVPYESLHVQVDQLDPAAWHPAAPPARLSLAADFVPEGDGLAGRFTLHNHQPGALDQQRLPLMDLRGHLRWQAGRATFSELVASLSGGGRLLGQGAWRERHLQLELSAHQLDLAKIDSRLRPTRLVGALGASLGADRQAVRVSLRDARYQLEADVTLQGGHLKIPHLKLAAQAARLDLQGEMQLDVPRRFSAAGQLQDFDPSRFAQLPAARLNADWQASGQLAPQPRLEARFRLHDSQIVQQPLQGQGTLSLDWPKIPRMEIELRAGSNRLQVSGAYGQPEDRLQLAVDAAHLDELAGLGLAGGLVGQGVLVGDWRSPQLNLQLSAVALGWRDHFRLAGLKLALNTGPPPAVPLNLDLSIARLDLPERPALLQQFQLTGEGVLAAHRLRVHTEVALAGSNQLTLAIQSGWDATRQRWHGQLLEAAVQAAERARNVRLLQPAAFSLAAQHWQLEPLALSSPLVDGQIHLQGRADAQRMQLEIKADGARIGQVSGELQAAMQGAWSLDKRARWQGGLHVDMADLGWLAEWMGEGWASGGRLQGDVQLAGSPAQPWASGRLRGLDLSLRLPEQGLTLARGALDVELRDNRLQIHRFGFESPLQPPPRALRQVGGESLARLTAQPGRLDMVGEMRFDQPTGVKDVTDVTNAAHAWLDLRLDRVGVWQRADQWALVSGSNRIGWQAGVLALRGLLTVDAGYWQLARMGVPRLSEDVHVRRAGTPPATVHVRPRLDLEVTADLGRQFLFEGAGLTSGLAGQVRISALGRDLPRASGSIQARDGRFEAYGQKLEIERGILRFNGLLDNPGLDVRAVRRGLVVEPGVQIGGSAQKPVVRLISEPDLPEAEKLAWLVLGHGSEQMGVGDASVLLSAAGDLFGNDAANVVGQLRKTFGIDEIGIRQGSLADNGSRAPTSRVAGGSVDTAAAANGQQIFSIAKRLSSDILLSYEQAMGKAESLVKLTVNLGRQVSVIGRAGSDNAIDILYTLSFGKPAVVVSVPVPVPTSKTVSKPDSREAACSGRVNCPE